MASVMFQPTPNPNSMKFVLDRPVVSGASASYMSAEAAQDSPLASALFAVEGVAGLFMLSNFITVTKSSDARWEEILPKLQSVIEEHFG